MGLLAFPALQAAAILQLMDRIVGTSFFLPSGLMVGGVPRDLTRPFVGLERGQACMLFVGVPPQPTTLGIVQEGVRLAFTVHGAQTPWVGLWLNRGGWSPFPKRRSLWARVTRRSRAAYCNFALEPCFSAFGSLAAAVDDGNARWLAPGETHRWDMTLTGSPT